MANTIERPPLTIEDFEARFSDRHLLHGVVEKWAREKPSSIALIDADGGRRITWAEFDAVSTTIAQRLVASGFHKGETFATLLPLTPEHVFLEYGCFKAGVIFVPLDLRLPRTELLRCLRLVDANGFAFWKVPDPAALYEQVQSTCSLRLLPVQIADPVDWLEGTMPFPELMRTDSPQRPVPGNVSENDGALVIFTTGSTGSPKPALLSHRGISCQAMCISQALLKGEKELVTLVNLPASHVGGQTELLMGTIFEGGTAALVSIFDPLRSLKAVQDYRATVIGQIPAMFQFEWRLKDYETIDLSSLEFVAYGGQKVSESFLDKMGTMAPSVGTGLGLTETSGFCTYIRRESLDARECAATLGHAMPVYPMSVREPMRTDGFAGDELADGEVGHICFRGPQTFLGYINDPASTAATISTDGYLYTGDLGYIGPDGLHLAGRARWVIKPGGYQVFPGDVENFFCAMDEVASCAVVGVEHPILSEAIVAFLEKKPGMDLNVASVTARARGLATYMRPRHYVVLEPGQMPLNRVAKADYLALSQRAQAEVEELKSRGLWGNTE